MSYYTEINGKKYDKKILDLAGKLTTGRGDGRLSQSDAQQIFEAVRDGGNYTDVEKETVQYVRETYKWTDGADEWFRTEVRKWAAKK